MLALVNEEESMVLEGFVDTQEACRLLDGVSRQRLHTLQATGRIGCVYINGRRIYKRDRVLKLRDELREKRGDRS